MTTNKLRLVIIIGSTRRERRSESIAAWFSELVRQTMAFDVDVIDLANFDVPAAIANIASSNIRETAARLDVADAFVIVTPEYNHGYPAALKAMIDSMYTEFRAKPIGFVSHGGVSGGLRAVEQLRLVFVEMHAVSVRDSVAMPNVHDSFDGIGFVDPEPIELAASRMLNQLNWWAGALQQARSEQSYAA